VTISQLLASFLQLSNSLIRLTERTCRTYGDCYYGDYYFDLDFVGQILGHLGQCLRKRVTVTRVQ